MNVFLWAWFTLFSPLHDWKVGGGLKTFDHSAVRRCFKLILTGVLITSLGFLQLACGHGQSVGSTILAQLPSFEQAVGWGGAVGW